MSRAQGSEAECFNLQHGAQGEPVRSGVVQPEEDDAGAETAWCGLQLPNGRL